MGCIPHGRWGPARCKSNCEEHAGSDKRFENTTVPIPWLATAWNSIYKWKNNTENSGSEFRSEHATSM